MRTFGSPGLWRHISGQRREVGLRRVCQNDATILAAQSSQEWLQLHAAGKNGYNISYCVHLAIMVISNYTLLWMKHLLRAASLKSIQFKNSSSSQPASFGFNTSYTLPARTSYTQLARTLQHLLHAACKNAWLQFNSSSSQPSSFGFNTIAQRSLQERLQH